MKKVSLLVIVVFCVTTVWSQNRIPLIGEQAPSFKAKTTNGNINFPKDFGDNWKILLSHPKDFTPVCTSEIMQLARMQDDFDKLGVKVAIVSADEVLRHQSWKQSMEEIEQEGMESVNIKFPLIDDKDASISSKYGMLHEKASTSEYVRGVFIIDPDNTIQSINFYPMRTGRNMEELKRLIVALQTTDESKVLTPVNWEKGDDVLLPYKPYADSDLKDNPDLKNQYYNVGTTMWYKRMK